MFDAFEPFSIKTQDAPPVFIRGIRGIRAPPASSLPPLLLLHGFPQTFHMWHRLAPLLSAYHLILPDLRGYGSSSKPAHDISQYAKSIMARDMIRVMDALGFAGESFFVCGHDRGARVAHKLMVDFPGRVRSAILLDICPTLGMYTRGGPEFAKVYFHWYLLMQPEPLPETLVLGDPSKMVGRMLPNRRISDDGRELFDEEVLGCFYAPGFADEETVHGWCQEYRASATLDLEEAREDLAEGRRVRCPVRVLLGSGNAVWKMFDGVKEWREVVEEGVEVDVRMVEAGHFMAEEVAEEVASHCLEVFV